MLPSADFPREGSKDLSTQQPTRQQACLYLPLQTRSPAHPKAQPRGKAQARSSYRAHTDSRLGFPTKTSTAAKLRSATHKHHFCFQPLANIIETLSKSCCPAASLLPTGTSERTITLGSQGISQRQAPSHLLHYKSQIPGGHREFGVSRQK